MSILQFLVYIAPLVMAIIAICALWQIKVAKDDIKIRSKREAAILTVEQMRFYSQKIVSDIDICFKKSREMKLNLYPVKLENFYFEEVNANDSVFNLNWTLFLKDDQLKQQLVETANHLESMAIAFTEGVANEKMAFNSLSLSFCKFVGDFWFYYCAQRNLNKVNIYDHTIKLYKLWSDRLKTYDLVTKSEEIKEELRKLPNKEIWPLGTK